MGVGRRAWITTTVRGLRSSKERLAENQRAARLTAVGPRATLDADGRRFREAPLGAPPIHEHVDEGVAVQDLRQHRDQGRMPPAHHQRGAVPPVLARGTGGANAVADDGALSGLVQAHEPLTPGADGDHGNDFLPLPIITDAATRGPDRIPICPTPSSSSATTSPATSTSPSKTPSAGGRTSPSCGSSPSCGPSTAPTRTARYTCARCPRLAGAYFKVRGR